MKTELLSYVVAHGFYINGRVEEALGHVSRETSEFGYACFYSIKIRIDP